MSFWLRDLEGLALQAALLGLAGYTALRAGCALIPDSAGILERLVLAGLVGVIGWVTLLQVLGLLGVLWLPVVIASLALLAGTSKLLLPAPGRLRWAQSPVPWGVVAAAAGFALLALVDVLWAPPFANTSYDTLHYHIVNAAQYLDSGSIRSLPFAQPGDDTGAEPGNGSLLLLAVMLPFHAAGLVDLPNLLCAALLVGFSALLARELGRDGWTGALAGLVVVTTACFFETQVRSAYDDSLALLGLVAAMACGLRSARTGARAPLLLAGLSLGLAVGAKEAYILPGLVVAAAVLWAQRASWSWRRALEFLLAIATLSLAWYVRNWVIIGNPIFPETVRIGSTVLFPGLEGSASAFGQFDPSLLQVLLGRQGVTATGWLELAVINLGMSLAALIALPVLVVRSGGTVRLVAVAALGCALAYVVTPFTGSAVTSQVNGTIRFQLPAIALAVVAIGATMSEYRFRLAAALTLGVNAALVMAVGSSRAGFFAALLLGVTATVAVAVVATRRWQRILTAVAGRRSVRIVAGLALVAVTIPLTAHLQPSSAQTPVERALQSAGDPSAPVVVMDVGDVATLLGPRLETHIVAAGEGPVGAERPILDAALLTSRIEALHPAAVVVGSTGLYDVVPSGWAPPPSWRTLGTQDGAIVYQPEASPPGPGR